MRSKKIVIIAVFGLLTVFVTVAVLTLQVKTQVKELFKLNKKLQKEGYYMADFEFRMLGFSYLLDKGKYYEAINSLSKYYAKLKKRDGLIKIPDFNSKQEEIDFFLNLQNPDTGAFVDESAPYCIYWEISQNIINHLEALSDSTTAPLQLKYPLKFLDDINTSEKLTSFLNDISYVGWIASKFPQTSFHFARNILDCSIDGNTLERNNLYNFSPEWKHAMLTWMYDFQDSTSGMWGPKNKKTGKLLKYDLNNTASILKAYRDNDGNDLYEEFPLQYTEKLFSSAMRILTEPYPADEEALDEIHEWNLKKVKGFNMILRYLWNDASKQDKQIIENLLEDFIKMSFVKYYVKSEGAFSYYPHAKHASADGFSNIIFENIGAFSYTKQKKLFGDSVDSIQSLGNTTIENLQPLLQKISEGDMKINSIRFYKTKPDISKLTENVWAVYYPNKTDVLDVTELVPNLIAWADSTAVSIGNWTSVEEKKRELESLNIKKPISFRENIVESLLEGEEDVYCIGFNFLQIPKFVIKCNSNQLIGS
ncbi:MAG TPA: hypothetical protein VK957_17730 [Lunatimonas sp.]|nr:hypothetical protein [Lunatimonas sp.]